MFSISKIVPRIFRELSTIYQRQSCLSSIRNIQADVLHFPVDRKWFEHADEIISNQFGSTFESLNAQNVHQIMSSELLSAVAIMRERIGSKPNATISNLERKCQTGSGSNNFFQATSILLMSCIDHDKLPTMETVGTFRKGNRRQVSPLLWAKCPLELIIVQHKKFGNILKLWKLIENRLDESISEKAETCYQDKVIREQQLTLATLTEMMYFSTDLHSQISEMTDQHVTNKILITLGDYILAQILFRLSDLKQPDLIGLLLTYLRYKSEAIFIDFAENETKCHEWTIKHWIDKNQKNYAFLFAVNFYSVLQFAKVDDHFVKNVAFEFGKNLGLAVRVFQDINSLADNELALLKNLKVIQRVFTANAQANLKQLPLNDAARECFKYLLYKCEHV